MQIYCKGIYYLKFVVLYLVSKLFLIFLTSFIIEYFKRFDHSFPENTYSWCSILENLRATEYHLWSNAIQLGYFSINLLSNKFNYLLYIIIYYIKKTMQYAGFERMNFLLIGRYLIHCATYCCHSKCINPHAPDRFTPSGTSCAENCGSALTYFLFGKK